jgi:hypothetical protein
VSATDVVCGVNVTMAMAMVVCVQVIGTVQSDLSLAESRFVVYENGNEFGTHASRSHPPPYRYSADCSNARPSPRIVLHFDRHDRIQSVRLARPPPLCILTHPIVMLTPFRVIRAMPFLLCPNSAITAAAKFPALFG